MIYKAFSDPARIQTWNLLIRSQILYSVELRGLLFWVANISENEMPYAYW